jgi:hypothetical protein
MPNMTPEELREHISKEMGWWAPGSGLSKDIGSGFDAYPQRTDKFISLFADLCGEVIPDKILTVSTCYSDGFNAAIDLSAARLTKLTGKEMNQ